MAFWLSLFTALQISVPALPTPAPLHLTEVSSEDRWDEGQVRVWKLSGQVLTETKIRGMPATDYRKLYQEGLTQSGCEYNSLAPDTSIYSFGAFNCAGQKRAGWVEIFSANSNSAEAVSRVVEFENEKMAAADEDQASLLLADLQQHPQWFWTKTRRLVNSVPTVFESAEWSECQRASPDLIQRIKESLDRKDRKCYSEEDGPKKTYICKPIKVGQFEMTYSFYATGTTCAQTKALARPLAQAAAP